MKPIRLVALSLLTFLVVFSVAVAAMSFIDRFAQSDMLPVNKPTGVPDTDDTQLLRRVSAEKTKEKEALKDTISQNFEDLGALKPKADKIKQIMEKTALNLKQVAATGKDVQPIEKVYRIDTSSRPVVISVTFPPQFLRAPEPREKRKGFLHRRD